MFDYDYSFRLDQLSDEDPPDPDEERTREDDLWEWADILIDEERDT